MTSLISTLLAALQGRPPKLVCPNKTWQRGVTELRRRAGGYRESGAFLLGTQTGKTRRIKSFLFYDDVDPTCFKNGIVEFDGGRLGEVWQKCRTEGLTVVADIHVHPGGYGQSSSDQHNPIIPEAGHLALILPNFAARKIMPGSIGVYEYLGGRKWKDHSLADIFYIGWVP